MAAKRKPAGTVDVVEAIDTFHGPDGLYVTAGQTYPAGHPVVVARPHLFRPPTSA